MVGKTSNGIKLIRLNSSLDTIWTRSLSTDFFYYNFEMYEMQDSTLILSGEAPFGFPTHFMGSIYHLDREGNILWQSPHEESPLASSFSCDFRDSLIYSVSNTGGANFDSVLKITCYDFFNYSVIWQKVVTDSILYGSVKLFANSTRVTDSGIIVAGFEHIDSAGVLTDKQLVMKFDFNGNLLWSKKYNEGIFGKCVKNNSGGIVCLGTTQDTTVLMSLDENGNQLCKNNIRSFALSYSNDLVVTNDSGYAFVCEARYSSVLAYVVKTDSLGQIDLSSNINLLDNPGDDFDIIYFENILNINSKTINPENSILLVYSVNGQMVLQKNISEISTRIYMNQFTSGEYIAAILNAKSSLRKSFKFFVH